MHQPDCIFCKIARGEIPAFRVLETDDLLAFLDVGPLAEGHTLLIPKGHFRDIRDLPPETLAKIAVELPPLAAAVMRATGATGLNLLHNTGATSGQAVFHFHVHLIPRAEGDGLGYRWNARRYEPGRGELLQSRILGELRP